MTNKDLITAAKEIVITMIETRFISATTKDEINNTVNETLESIYLKLAELNSKDVKYGYEIPRK